ncbi:MAG: 4Fe-4S binding protein [Candidatus Nealsonbacteria bacterium]|nr:4Fe-4S binding protein [Candidatus Nealsonbacteria bacterium]
MIQLACFVAFVWLFCYVCWPYTARPTRAWHDWLPVEVDAETGQVVVATESPQPEPIAEGMVLFVVDRSDEQDRGATAFEIIAGGENELTIEPAKPLSDADRDWLEASFGPWSLYETDPADWPSHYADELTAKETVAAEAFLAIDPLVSISTALAGKTFVWSLGVAAGVLAVCLLIPRGFCGYVCPLGTLVDLFDWAVGRWVRRLHLTARGRWVNLKYHLLAATLSAALCGVLISGYVAAIPVVTRGMAFLITPLQTAGERDWYQVPSHTLGQWVSIGLLLLIPCLGLLRPRFWCRYLCPSGAVFSLANLLRLTDRKVQSQCTGCSRCVKVCPFDAIEDDFTTRGTDCTFCQTCGGACPVRAIQFVPRWSKIDLKPPEPSPDEAAEPERRRFLAATIGVAVGCLGGAAAAGAVRLTGPRDGDVFPPVRPPGSVAEPLFLQMCIRCGECYQACPNDAIQPLGLRLGLDGLWTPELVPDWSGCEPSCSNCGRVCPTGAIRALPLKEKRVARIGLAVVNEKTCLPYAGVEKCQLCKDECDTAGYRAIRFQPVGTEVDEFGVPIEGTAMLAPVVSPERCVGCGLCQTRCRAINVVEKGLLSDTAIRIVAGGEKEDRMTDGWYTDLRDQEDDERRDQQEQLIEQTGGPGGYMPKDL